eukprot:1157730-Pelagomonas_calceolata.AAC.3
MSGHDSPAKHTVCRAASVMMNAIWRPVRVSHTRAVQSWAEARRARVSTTRGHDKLNGVEGGADAPHSAAVCMHLHCVLASTAAKKKAAILTPTCPVPLHVAWGRMRYPGINWAAHGATLTALQVANMVLSGEKLAPVMGDLWACRGGRQSLAARFHSTTCVCKGEGGVIIRGAQGPQAELQLKRSCPSWACRWWPGATAPPASAFQGPGAQHHSKFPGEIW